MAGFGSLRLVEDGMRPEDRTRGLRCVLCCVLCSVFMGFCRSDVDVERFAGLRRAIGNKNWNQNSFTSFIYRLPLPLPN